MEELQNIEFNQEFYEKMIEDLTMISQQIKEVNNLILDENLKLHMININSDDYEKEQLFNIYVSKVSNQNLLYLVMEALNIEHLKKYVYEVIVDMDKERFVQNLKLDIRNIKNLEF